MKAKVEAKLKKTNPTIADMLNLTVLYATNSSIIDLTGLEYATNLTELQLYNNHITNLSPLAGSTKLKYLDVRANPLNGATHQTWIPLIKANNPIMILLYDPYSCQITILSPNGGENLPTNQPVAIKWSAQNISTVNLEYSLDNGTTWEPIATVPCSSDNTCWWQPQTSGEQYLIRISDNSYNMCSDISDAVFSVRTCLLSPSAGDINLDCKVDINDLAILAKNWLADGR